MSLEHRLHIQSEEPDLLIEFDLPPGTHATIGASPKSEITLPLTGIPPFSFILGRFQDGQVFIADLNFFVTRLVHLPDALAIPPYQFALYHPAEPEPEAAATPPPEVAPSSETVRDQIANRIRSLFRKDPSSAPTRESPPPEQPPTDPPPEDKAS